MRGIRKIEGGFKKAFRKNIAVILMSAVLMTVVLPLPLVCRAGPNEMAQARHFLEKGEKGLDQNALASAEQLFQNECKGPARDPLCEYYLARIYLARYSYWAQVAGDSTKAAAALSSAEAMGRQAVARRPGDASVHVLMGRIYQVKLSRYPMSGISRAMVSESPVVKEFERALSITPESGEAELGLGIYYQFMPRVLGGDGHRARNHFKRAARLMPRNPEPLVWVSISYREEGRPKDARKYLDQALAIDSNNPFVREESRRLMAAEKGR